MHKRVILISKREDKENYLTIINLLQYHILLQYQIILVAKRELFYGILYIENQFFKYKFICMIYTYIIKRYIHIETVFYSIFWKEPY